MHEKSNSEKEEDAAAQNAGADTEVKGESFLGVSAWAMFFHFPVFLKVPG